MRGAGRVGGGEGWRGGAEGGAGGWEWGGGLLGGWVAHSAAFLRTNYLRD